MVADRLMGGVAQGEMSAAGRPDVRCIGLQGEVSTQNGGGFVQVVCEIHANDPSPQDGAGIGLEVFGNGEAHHLQLRTSGGASPNLLCNR